MNRKRLKQIEETARRILIEQRLYNTPVDVYSVANGLGLGVVPHDFANDVSGLLITSGGKSTIGINSNNGVTRKRFTIAHEIGHYVLGHQREGAFIDKPGNFFTIVYRDSSSSTGEFQQEREANAFAAALLMPRELIDITIKKMSFDFEDDQMSVIDILAHEFEVSSQAMSFRLSNLEMLW